jgi:hypothetical protein
MMAIIFSLLLVAGPPVPSPDFQCGPDDSACWRRMTLWEHNQAQANADSLDDAQKALDQQRRQTEKCAEAQQFPKFTLGVAVGGAVTVVGFILLHHWGVL